VTTFSFNPANAAKPVKLGFHEYLFNSLVPGVNFLNWVKEGLASKESGNGWSKAGNVLDAAKNTDTINFIIDFHGCA
jgi:hypothetical protein